MVKSVDVDKILALTFIEPLAKLHSKFSLLNDSEETWMQKIKDDYEGINVPTLSSFKKKYGSFKAAYKALSDSRQLYQCPAYWLVSFSNDILKFKLDRAIDMVEVLNSTRFQQAFAMSAKCRNGGSAESEDEVLQFLELMSHDLDEKATIYTSHDACSKAASEKFRSHRVEDYGDMVFYDSSVYIQFIFGFDVDAEEAKNLILKGTKEAVFPHIKVVFVGEEPGNDPVPLTYQNGKIARADIEIIKRSVMPDRSRISEVIYLNRGP